MRYFARLAILTVVILLVAACESATPAIPTLIPTDTPPPTLLPTATETPVLGPSPTPGYSPETFAADTADQVYFRAIHAAPDAPEVDIYVELLAVATNLAFKDWTESTGLVAGTYTVQVIPSGTRLNESALLTTTLSFEGGKSLILLFTGTADNLALSVYEQSTAPLDSGQARVNTINAVPRGVDYTLREANSDLMAPVSFGQRSSDVVLGSGQKTFIFHSGDTVLYTYPADLLERHAHTFVMVGRSDDLNSLSVIDLDTIVPGRSSIRVINASPTLGPVDVYLDQQPVAQQVAYPRASDRQYAPTNTYDALVYPVGADRANTDPITSMQLSTNPGDVITLIVVGSVENARIVLLRQDVSPTAPNQSRIAFMNIVETSPQVQVQLAGGPVPGVSSLFFGQVSPEVMIDSGTTSFYWSTIENGVASDPLETAENLQIEPGRSYLYLCTGTPFGPPLIFSELVGIDQALVAVEPNVRATATPIVPTRIRFINAMVSGTLIDFRIDDEPTATGIALGQGTPIFTVASDDAHVFTVHNSGTSALLARLLFTLDQPGDYTLLVFGSETITQVEMLLISDSDLNFDQDSAHLRLINLTQGEFASFGLAYSEPVTASLPSESTPAAVTDANARPPLPIGVVRLVSDIEPNHASSTLRIEAGLHSVIVIDSQHGGMAVRIPSVEFENGVHYDVVVFQEGGSLQVRAYVVPYDGS